MRISKSRPVDVALIGEMGELREGGTGTPQFTRRKRARLAV
jgi:hypothetical protein